MNGLVALLGSGEYLPIMSPVDHHLLDSLGLRDRKPRVVCLPTAAGREGDGSVNRWSAMGTEHFRRLDAQVTALPIIDRESADRAEYEPVLESADVIYFSGGDPQYLYDTLQGSRAWAAAGRAWDRGAIYAGCSAGAMILAEQIPNFRFAGLGSQAGFGLLPVTFVLPHFDEIPALFKPIIFALRRGLKAGQVLLGIDENTALVGRIGGEWTVMGTGRLHHITRGAEKLYSAGERVRLEAPAREPS
jgi:cyanophycinase